MTATPGATTFALWETLIRPDIHRSNMSEVASHENRTGDDEDPEETVRVIEGHAVQFTEYRY